MLTVHMQKAIPPTELSAANHTRINTSKSMVNSWESRVKQHNPLQPNKKCLIAVLLYSNHHDETCNFAPVEILREPGLDSSENKLKTGK